MSTPQAPQDPSMTPGTPEYRRRLRDQNKQFDTTGLNTEWDPADQQVDNLPRGTAQTPTKYPTGADTEYPVNDE